MSKELEALEIECGELVEMDLLFLDRNGENQEKWHNSEAFEKAVAFEKKYGKSHTCILKEALQRLEAIENAKPSEAVECILDIKSNYKFYAHNNRAIDYQCSVIVQALLKTQEMEKILKIINEKGLPLGERDMILHSKDYEEYSIKFSWANFKNISIQKTKEEFKILKETLKP